MELEEEHDFINDKLDYKLWPKIDIAPQHLHIIVLSWNNNSHGLFDYEMKEVVRTEFIVTKSAKLITK